MLVSGIAQSWLLAAQLYARLVVVRLIVEKIWNVNVNCVKVNGAQNIGQGHWVNIPAKSGGQGDVSCKV